MILPIVAYGDPVLKKEAEEISDEIIFGMIYEACGDRNGKVNLA
jgi:hypothetical protein